MRQPPGSVSSPPSRALSDPQDAPAARRPRWLASALLLLTAFAVVFANGSTAHAHRSDVSYLYIDVGDSSLSGSVQMPYTDLRTVFGMELSGTPEELLAEVESELTNLHSYVEARTSIGADGESWDMTFEGFRLLNEREVGPAGTGHVVFPYEVDVPVTEVPQLLDIEFTVMIDEIDGRRNVVVVSNDWKRGVIDEEANALLTIDSDTRSGTIDLGETSQWKNFRTSIDLGVDHIRTGPDHVFFILVLLLPAVLVLVSSRWRPSPSFGYSLLRIVVVATMFTIAHSITFTLAGLDYLPLPPSKLTETVIALSIALAALHNLRPVFGHREWLFAFVFGLFHGMGFAGLVEELEITRSTQLVSLLGRNVGIEIAQLIIILLLFPLLFLLRRTRVYMPAFTIVSVGLAIVSGIWMIERIFERNLRINRAVDAALEWPRALWVMLGLTALAAVYQEIERRADRLLPVVEHDSLRGEEPVDDAEHDDADQQPTPV